jgi:hypothetical protein
MPSLDWRQICDGILDCANGAEERECLPLEAIVYVAIWRMNIFVWMVVVSLVIFSLTKTMIEVYVSPLIRNV